MTPPNSLESEQAFIGAILIDGVIIKATALEVEDIYNKELREIFSACKQLDKDWKEIDMIVIRDYLKSIEKLDYIGGFSYLAELTELSPISANWKQYEAIIKDKSVRRQIIKYAQEMRICAEDESLEASKSIENISSVADILFDKNKGNTIVDLMDDFAEAREEYNSNGWLMGLATPYPQLDIFTRGLKRKKVFTIAAFSNSWKTSISYTYVRKLLQDGEKVVWFTLDGDKQTVICDMIQCMYSKSESEIMNENFEVNMEDFQNLTVYEKGKTLDEIEIITSSIKPYAIVIDYVQKIYVPGMWPNRVTQLDYVASRIQDIAINTNTAVILLSQVANSDKGSNTANLKWSGELYSAADDIILLYREDDFTRLKVLKTKKGIVGKEFIFSGDFDRYQFKLVEELPDNKFSFKK